MTRSELQRLRDAYDRTRRFKLELTTAGLLPSEQAALFLGAALQILGSLDDATAALERVHANRNALVLELLKDPDDDGS